MSNRIQTPSKLSSVATQTSITRTRSPPHLGFPLVNTSLCTLENWIQHIHPLLPVWVIFDLTWLEIISNYNIAACVYTVQWNQQDYLKICIKNGSQTHFTLFNTLITDWSILNHKQQNSCVSALLQQSERYLSRLLLHCEFHVDLLKSSRLQETCRYLFMT